MYKTRGILIIDDDAGDRTLCSRSLKSALGDDLRLVEADSGESGLKAIEENAFVCVLLDYSLPGINGLEVLKRIRVNHPHLAVVMLDGKGNDVIAVQSMKEGAQDYIAKSAITPQTLQRAVEMAVQHSTLQKNSVEQRASLEIFTHALAHDLKEPLRTIRSFLDQITEVDELSEKSQRSFQRISKAATRMHALIDVIYLYTRLDAAEHMERTPCDIADVLKDVQENLAKLIEERGATITSDILPLVHANRVQMIQLFQNLIANAIRHSESPVTVHVCAEEQEDAWQLTVHDNGPGIKAEYLQKIFDPFQRLTHRREDTSGMGLGLAINRKIVESHGGKIRCESVFGEGCSFLFTLPKAMGNVERSDISSSALSKRASKADMALARILLVDDNEDDIEAHQRMLAGDTNLRCGILTARDGKEALVLLKQAAREKDPIDLLLLDINMPIMNGFELLEKMRAEQMLPGVLVVMCTTSDHDKDKQMAESLGASGYLVKPPEFALLKDIITRCRNLSLCQEGSDYALRRAA